MTTDTYRIAAVDQLRAFADMLGVPFAVAFTPADLHRIVREHEHADRILIDTSGYGPFDRESANNLRGTLASCQPATLLCLPAGGRRIDLEAQFDGFELIDPDAVIITKWDETSAPGESISMAVERRVPISHVTVGQQVPEDIVVADSGVLAASALSLDEHEAEDLL